MSNLNDFIHQELYPALYDNIPFAFPDMGFTMARDGWHSPKKMDGTEPRTARPDKCVITKKAPYRILEQGGDSKDLLTFQMERRSQSVIEAVKSLADICGLQVPSGDLDNEEWKRRKEARDKRERQAERMSSDLFTLPEAKPTLDYLRNERGYPDEHIIASKLGYCSKEMAREVEGAPYGAGSTFTLVIPCRDGRGIYGFKFRSIDQGGGYRNTSGMEKSEHLFGLSPTRHTRKEDKELVIVEGELDALRAQYAGLDNVVAAAGGVVSPNALTDAKALGFDRVVVLFDTEGTEAKKQDNSPERIRKSREETEQKIKKAVEVIAEAGFKPFVATLPSESGEKVDADSYLANHSADDLRKVIAEANSGANYLHHLILRDIIEKQGEGTTSTDALYSEYKDKVLRLLLNEKVVSPTDEDTVLFHFLGNTNGIYSKEALLKEKEAMRAKEDGERRISDTIEAATKALDLARKGKTEESIELMGRSSNELRRGGKEEKFRRMLALPTQEGIYERFKAAPSGIPTDYVFSEGDKKERLHLPEGALTFVCAPSSHGKSTMLRNLALQVLRAAEKDKGTVLYYTLEEDYNSTLKLFVNTAFGRTITSGGMRYNNLTTINEYYKSGRTDTKYIRSDARDFPDFERKWIDENIVSGRLRIISEADFDSRDLIDHIEYTAAQLNVKAVFIDYVQLLFTDGNRKSRNEELRDICKDLRRLSIRTSLPIVAAAQLNREAKSPIEMKLTTIADSIDIAREANIALYLWNSAFEADNGSAYENPKTRAKQISVEKQPELGTRGQIYAVLRKNRGGLVNIDALLDFDGNTGVIKPNYSESDFSQESTEETFPDLF